MSPSTLIDTFGEEFLDLPSSLAILVVADFQSADHDSQRDYFRNIGGGNLLSYAQCLAIQFEQVGQR